MGLSDTSKINIALKKVKGKAQTSNTKEVSNESIGSNISIAASTIFGTAIPTPVSSAYYAILGGAAEKVRLTARPIDGTKDGNGRYQAFALQLPADYEASSSNNRAGTGIYVDSQILTASNGELQVLPPTFGSSYTALAYHTASGETQIAALDDRDWVLDYYNGVLFQQDPPSDTDENPVYVDAFIYIGEYVQTRLTGGAGGGGGIFTVTDTSHAYTTSSLNVGVSGSASYPLSVTGISQLSGGIVHKRVGKAGDYTLTTADYVVGVDTSGAVVTLTLPSAATALDGQTWVIKDEGGNASTNNITITGSADTNTIDGQNSIVLESNNASVQIYCDGVSKYFVF